MIYYRKSAPFPSLLLAGGDIGVITTDENDVQRLAVRAVERGGAR